MAAGVNKQATDNVLVHDVASRKVAWSISTSVVNVVTDPERRIAGIARRVVLVAHVGQADQ